MSMLPVLPRSESAMRAEKARFIFAREAAKGCLPDISALPVHLEPPYQPMRDPYDILGAPESPFCCPASPPRPDEWVRYQVWVPSEYACDWLRTEAFIKQLQALSHRVVLDVCGGKGDVVISILCHREDTPIVNVAFSSQFCGCELAPLPDALLAALPQEGWQDLSFLETCVPPPYTELLTRPAEFQIPPLEVFLHALLGLPGDATGLYQIIIQPSHPDHRWHRNVEILVDLQYFARLYGLRSAQQAPSGQLNGMANDVERKAHPDKPFFHALARVGVWSPDATARTALLRALATFMGLFQHGGQPLQFVSDQDYRRVIGTDRIRDMFMWGVTHRPGTLLNSLECCGLLHLPSVVPLVDKEIRGCILTPVPADSQAYHGGILIGHAERLGKQQEVYLSDQLGMEHVHMIGKPGRGKSSSIAGMALRNIERGHGIVVIDPHGDLAEDILVRMPEAAVERCIYLEPGHPYWVPLWNPLLSEGPVDRVVDDFIRSFMNVTQGWGHRAEGLFRQALYGLIACGEATLHNVSILFSPHDPGAKRLREKILGAVRNQKARHFWQYEYSTYKSSDLAPAQNKLMKLLLYDTPSLMFGQKESRINTREIMDNNGILIADLSSLGPEAQEVIGSLLLNCVHHSAISRSDIRDRMQRKPFHGYVDEMHKFVNDGLPKMLVEMRKFACGLVLASHYLGQVDSPKQIEALSGVGTTFVFQLGSERVEQVTRFLGGDVEKEELLKLERQHAVVRLDTEVFRIKTPDLPPPTDPTVAERVKRYSRERYARPAEELYAEMGASTSASLRRPGRVPAAFTLESDAEAFEYDEL